MANLALAAAWPACKAHKSRLASILSRISRSMLAHSAVSAIALLLFGGALMPASALDIISVYQPLVTNMPTFNDTTWAFMTAAAEFNRTYAGRWAIDIVNASWADIATFIKVGDASRGGRFPDVIVVGGTVGKPGPSSRRPRTSTTGPHGDPTATSPRTSRALLSLRTFLQTSGGHCQST
ncbi:hypothetical protein M427DRAFT_130836 [Gonapodya prolifera JEL478]|uniref:Uncharacterized protein n=1 Tax=Gonapodya prolifera (strain JEL478) TaxID=1344416 RepID=A0A139AY13_GONPJ|nr:hypothetical protein M427DRAFT_130836 [Gonapodya prolifera JEL478]|eukprot:KXS21345.1 hypothetical protein M427DRAFT_130836 [Gonapodya prolifera JEL478]